MRTEASHLARYESDLYEPKLRIFAVLARALDVSMEALLYSETGAARIADERERAGAGRLPAGG